MFQIRAGGGFSACGWGKSNCLKYLKGKSNRKGRSGNKSFQKGGGGGGASWVKEWVP